MSCQVQVKTQTHPNVELKKGGEESLQTRFIFVFCGFFFGRGRI